MEITIKNKTVKLRFTFASDMIYENLQNKTFDGKLQSDWIWYFYSTFLALSDEINTPFEDFLAELDSNPNLLNDFIKWYVDTQQALGRLTPQVKEETKKKKSSKKLKN